MRQWIIPEPENMSYLPLAAIIQDLLRDMESLGWLASPLPPLRVRRPVEGKPESLRIEVGELVSSIDQGLAASEALLVELPVSEGSESESSDVIQPGQPYAGALLLSRSVMLRCPQVRYGIKLLRAGHTILRTALHSFASPFGSTTPHEMLKRTRSTPR